MPALHPQVLAVALPAPKGDPTLGRRIADLGAQIAGAISGWWLRGGEHEIIKRCEWCGAELEPGVNQYKSYAKRCIHICIPCHQDRMRRYREQRVPKSAREVEGIVKRARICYGTFSRVRDECEEQGVRLPEWFRETFRKLEGYVRAWEFWESGMRNVAEIARSIGRPSRTTYGWLREGRCPFRLIPNLTPSPELARVIARHLADGDRHGRKNRVCLKVGDCNLARKHSEDIASLLGREPQEPWQTKDGLWYVEYDSDLLAGLLNLLKYVCLPAGFIPMAYREVIRRHFAEFVRAYCECDGTFYEAWGYLRLYSTSKFLLEYVERVAREEGWRIIERGITIDKKAGMIVLIAGRAVLRKRNLWRLTLKPPPNS